MSALENVDIVSTVSNGIEAIVEIRKTRPDCAIIDYNMPGANGLEVFLESKRWSPETRFMLLTGPISVSLVKALIDAGIHGVALKDGTEFEIVEIVRQVCAGEFAMGASARSFLKADTDTVSVTDRELSVLQAIARGHTNASAAESLGISIHTVRTHLARVFEKTGTNSQMALGKFIGKLSLPVLAVPER